MKNKLHISHQAITDLDDISDYITNQLKNPLAAVHTVDGIVRTMEQLEIFSGAGAIINFFDGSDSGYRFIIYKNYMIFYRVISADVFIDRIIYGRRDYMNILFDEK